MNTLYIDKLSSNEKMNYDEVIEWVYEQVNDNGYLSEYIENNYIIDDLIEHFQEYFLSQILEEAFASYFNENIIEINKDEDEEE